MSNFGEIKASLAKPSLPKGGGTALGREDSGGGEMRPLPKGERATKWRGDSIWKENTMLI